MDAFEAVELIEYTRWANARVLEAVSRLPGSELTREVGGSFGSILGTLAHMCGAEWVWLERFSGRSPRSFPGGDDLRTLDDVQARWNAVADAYAAFAATLDAGALGREIAYTSFKGDPFVRPLDDLLRHVVNHSTYHRGQIALLVRLAGATAVGTDLAAFQRERGARPR